MASRIKGITVEIGGDTVGLEAALKDVNKRTKEVQSELKDVQRLLKFDPNNVELLAQRQQLLTEAIESSTEKLNQLRSAQSQVEQQFRSGQIGEEQYRAFRRELQAAEQQLSGYEQALADMNAEQQRVQRGTRELQTLFDATGSSVEDYAGVIGQRLVRAIQNGTATGRDLEYAFQRIGRQAIGAGGDIEQLRISLQSVDSGNSIQNIRRDLQQLHSEADEVAESVEGIGDSLAGVAGALVAGGGIAGAVDQALNTSSLDTKIEISMEIPESSIESVKASVREVIAVIGDEEAAIEGVRRQWALNKEASDEANQAVITGATSITKAYAGVDFTELIQETNEISAALKISDEEALGLTNSLLKMGFPSEQLDIIAEYGTQLQRAGYSAEEVQAIMMAGVQTDSWNIDVLLDGLKEGRIVLAEFGAGVDDATAELLKGTGISTKQLQQWGKAVAAGGEGGSKAMVEVAKALEGVKDETDRNLVGVKLFGTLYEEHGSNLTQTLINAQGATVDLGVGVDNLSKSSEGIKSDPSVKLAQAIQDVKTAAEPTLAVIAEIISKIAGWISENPKLAATITTIVTGLGILIGILFTLAPIFTAITAAAGALGIGIGALIGWVAVIAAGIAALIAIGVLLYKNWDEIKAKAVEIWGTITDWFIQTWTNIKTDAAEMWDGFKVWLADTWNSIKETASNVWNSIKDFFMNYWDELLMIFTGPIGILVGLIIKNWDSIKSKTSEIWVSIKSWLSNTWEDIKNTAREKFEGLKNAIKEKMDAAKEKIETIWEKAQGFLEKINLFSIGKDIIGGLIDGLAGKAGDIYTKIAEIAGEIKRKFTGLFDINSPSRVFREYGFNMNEGLIQGLQASSYRLYKSVNSLYGNLANSAENMMEINRPTLNKTQELNNHKNGQSFELVKQPLIIQMVTPDNREMARWLVDDISDLQDFKNNRIKLFGGAN